MNAHESFSGWWLPFDPPCMHCGRTLLWHIDSVGNIPYCPNASEHVTVYSAVHKPAPRLVRVSQELMQDATICKQF